VKTLVTGAGGFIGGHLINDLLTRGHDVIGIDIKPREKWWQFHEEAENYPLISADSPRLTPKLLERTGDVYHLAENMGGIGFIETHRVDCLSSVSTSVSLLKMLNPGQHRLFFSSSACAYSQVHQVESNPDELVPLAEHMAWPALPEEGYGLQKLYVEKLCEWHRKERGLAVRVVRFHNSYGPLGSWNDGREKAPAAICRKVATAVLTGSREIRIWGDGTQLRSFMYIGDNIIGIDHLMGSGYQEPINLGSAELVSVDRLVEIVEVAAGLAPNTLKRIYLPAAPTGVAGRSSNNELLRYVTHWAPNTRLEDGIGWTYPWIYDQVKESLHE
jgi:GDP-D-mannose 3', 5'-epimerase